MARLDGLARCDDDEAEWYIGAAIDLTTEQLRMAGSIVARALPDKQGGVSDEMLVGVLNALATNFSAIAISRKFPNRED